MRPATIRLHFSDGTSISAWTRLEQRDKFTEPLSTLRLDVAPSADRFKEYRSKLAKGQVLSLLVDDKPQFAGFVQTCTTRVDPKDGATISIEAFNPLKLLYESTVDIPAMSKILNADGPIIDLVSQALAPYHIDVGGDADLALIKSRTGKNTRATATPTAELKFKEAQAQPNESTIVFLNRMLTRLGVLLRYDAGSSLVYITAPHYAGDPIGTLKMCATGTGPNGVRFFGAIEEVDSNEGQFSFCETTGATTDSAGDTQSSAPKARALTADINSRRPPFRSADGLDYKPCFHRDTNCRDKNRALSVSKLVLGLRAEEAYQIRGACDSLLSEDGTPWTVDTLARVFVPKLELDEVMWISERTFSADASGGQQTALTLIPKGNLVLGDLPS